LQLQTTRRRPLLSLLGLLWPLWLFLAVNLGPPLLGALGAILFLTWPLVLLAVFCGLVALTGR
jgi:hypothetical protein